MRNEDLSFESIADGERRNNLERQHLKNIRLDAINCITGSIAMRYALMGSKDKMEYTSIGDAVNFASRTEASNKACGTDILISEDTYNLLKMDYIRCEENGYELPKENIDSEILVEKIPVSFEVKGKGTQHFYGVVNMPNFDIKAFFSRGNSY